MIEYARRTWQQARLEDFERDGRHLVDRATGTVYEVAPGNPLLSEDPDVADLFVVSDGEIWFLLRVDRPQGRSKPLGSVGAVTC